MPGGVPSDQHGSGGGRNAPLLRVQGLVRPGLAPASFGLDRGRCLAVSGPSGSGKTLLLRAIADLDPCRGEVFLANLKRSQMPAPQWRQRVAYVAAESGWWADAVGAHSRIAKLRPRFSGTSGSRKTRWAGR